MASIPKTASDISATWLEEALAERYPGVSVAGLELLEVRHGTNSHARFEVSYTGEGLGPAPPRRIFAKLPPQEERQRTLVIGSGMGAREVHFYDRLANRVPMRVPVCHYAALDNESGEFVMLIEDLAESGYRFPAIDGAVTPRQAEGAMDDYAALHAALSDPEVDTSFVQPPLRQPEYGVGMLQRGLADYPDRMSPGFADIARVYCEHTHAMHDLWEAGPQVVNHGDGHLLNLFFDGERVGFLDWGCMSRAPAMRDVGYFICMALAIPDRRNHEKALIQRYLAKAAESGLHVPTFDEAWLQYRRQASYTVPGACPAVIAPENDSPNSLYAPHFLARAIAAVEDLEAATLLHSELAL